MWAKVKGVTVAVISILLLAAVAFSIWLLNKGVQQDKTYSGARFIYQEKAENDLL
ncbi:hypothetical protein JOD02_000177 [Caldicoprobacter guelmensis]|uniref:hypothetical protein n=1 Tax=Caldicoprobacter guelmensis TaxID=1170224 RepID=UPI001957EEF9|nr:hypothetical protein [Caldicoprobacter guelmensis]MBM7581354.1 hypothetical protein [Caldicoprobacter guelmensis]